MLKVALVGYGYWGKKLSRNFHNSEFSQILNISDTKKKNLIEAKKNYPIIKCYNDYEKAVTSNLINLVVVASPTATHFKIAKFALENNKNVLVEKPLSLSLSEVKKLNKIAKMNKKMIFVDYPFLFSGTIKHIKKIIDNKKYGKILEIESFREQAPLRKDANVIWDLCTHDVSILTYLLKSLPIKIRTIKSKNFNNYPVDSAYVNLKYGNGINVLIKNSWISAVKIRMIKIKFEKAILFCDENEAIYKIKIYKNNNKYHKDKYNMEIPEIDLTEPLAKMVKYIYFSIKNNTNILFENSFNLKITSLLERINKAND